ncbi:MAG: Na+/H+ antiporter NhaC family protein [Rikenellaceae bacterium]|nr:Na+/H+ antiporter NhaC family protein [Rikenellaceae bacterium]
MERNPGSYPDHIKPNGWALMPMAVFLGTYVAVLLFTGDIDRMPITVAFLLASAVALGMARGAAFRERVAQFCSGPADGNVMMMVVIFILAGAFAAAARQTGAVEAAVNLALRIVPADFITLGMFAAACFVSFSVGTSVGTIVALAPIASGMAAGTGLCEPLMVAIIISGAMFGDNLSFISDTTIVATRSQGCRMSDKFKVNLYIALPVAVVAALLYVIAGWGAAAPVDLPPVDWIGVLPYLAVIVAAVCGMNVILVLTLGIVLCGVCGLITGSCTVGEWTASLGAGATGMGELIIITLLAAGVFGMMRIYGGIAWLTSKLRSVIRTRKGAEAGMGALTGIADICTANNTVALVMTGPIARGIAARYGIDPRRSASLIDIYSCVVQGLIPYGAQLLMAAGLSGVAPLEMMPYLYYPALLGFGGAAAIATGYPRKFSSVTVDEAEM